MKLLITSYCDWISGQRQEAALIPLEQLINTLKTVSVRKSSQTVELQDEQSIQSKIESVLDNLDINTMLDPDMLNTGGLEVMATIKRDLSLELEAMLATQKH